MERTVTLQIQVPQIDPLSEALATAFAQCCAEAQGLEHAIKSAITKDLKVFAGEDEKETFLETLERVTLGQAKDIAMGNSKPRLAACVGFFGFVKTQWQMAGNTEENLADTLKDTVRRRNRIAHQLLSEVAGNETSEHEAVQFLRESAQRFFEMRLLIAYADALSSQLGSVATDGESLPRFKTTS